MPARDLYHNAVIKALIKQGWTITHDPLLLSYGGQNLFVDVGAKRTAIAAQRGEEKIAVEIKSFLSLSPMRDLQEAVGQYDVYRTILAETEPERTLYLAVPQRVYETVFTEKIGQLILKRLRLLLITFEEEQERIVQWIL